MRIQIGSEKDEAFIGAGQDLHADHLAINQTGRGRNNAMSSALYGVGKALVAEELEKRRIREEIMTAKIMRRRELEEEVIGELMLEREIAMRRGIRLPWLDSPFSLLRSDIWGPFLNSRDNFGIGRISGGLGHLECGIDGRLATVNHSGSGAALGCFPFQRQSVGALKGIIKPVTEVRATKAASFVKPTVIGLKRKLDTTVVSCSDWTKSVGLHKKSKKEWSCALCQVSATCEKGLNDHLKGKKHRAQEKALLRSSKKVRKHTGNSVNTGKSVEVAVTTTSMSPPAGNSPERNQEGMKECEPMDHKPEDSADFQIVQCGSPVSESQTTAEMDANNKYWCKQCNVGTSNEALMTAHRMGKKHMTLLREKGGGVIAIKTMSANVLYVNKSTVITAEGENKNSFGNAEQVVESVDGVRADKEEDANPIQTATFSSANAKTRGEQEEMQGN